MKSLRFPLVFSLLLLLLLSACGSGDASPSGSAEPSSDEKVLTGAGYFFHVRKGSAAAPAGASSDEVLSIVVIAEDSSAFRTGEVVVLRNTSAEGELAAKLRAAAQGAPVRFTCDRVMESDPPQADPLSLEILSSAFTFSREKAQAPAEAAGFEIIVYESME